LNPALKRFDTSCFTGEYVTGDITPEYLERLGLTRQEIREEQNGLLFNMGFAAED
jgi:amidophosphoribosyltransferase